MYIYERVSQDKFGNGEIEMAGKRWVVYYDIIREYHAGNKYENDVISIFTKCGFHKIRYGKQNENKVEMIFSLVKFCFSLFFFVRKKSVLFFLAPIMVPYDKILRMVSRVKKWELYAFIIDINGLRGTGNLENEISNLMNCNGIIVQNNTQKKFLQDRGYTGRVQVMNILDFLYEDNIFEKDEKKLQLNTICYGGNLSMKQSEFLYKWQECSENLNYKVLVYGVNLEKKIDNDFFHYMGQFSPNDVIGELKGSFGLVWNGSEIDTCGGSRGKYYRYANPHKLSMYIVARMPVIVWEESAVKDFVEDNGIGFSIKSLSEIQNKISHVSIENYKKMLFNVNNIREKITKGHYANACIKKILLENGEENYT